MIPTNYYIIIYNARPHVYLSSLSLPSSAGVFLERPIGTIVHGTITVLCGSERPLLEADVPSTRSTKEVWKHSPAIDLSKCLSLAVTADSLPDLAALRSSRRE